MRIYLSLIVAGFGAVTGFLFSAVSTYDSVMHLDREVHGIHCSYLPGMEAADTSGASGCYATLMSAYSSVWRTDIWGGIPVALPGMAVFAFLLFAVLYLLGKQRFRHPIGSGGFLAAALVPLTTSIGMAVISLTELDAVCKLCMGIYISSALVFAGALWMFIQAMSSGRREENSEQHRAPEVAVARVRVGHLFAGAGLGVVFVALSVGVYAASAPDFSGFVGSCGTLATTDGEKQVLLPLGEQNRPTPMIEVMDPLCAACAVFEKRFSKMPQYDQVQRQVLLFPLDNQCNWMIEESVHPGACAVSEAMICAGDAAETVLDYAISNQQRIIDAARKNADASAAIMKDAFPQLASCIGSAGARAKLNLALRFAVKHQLQIITPQIYVDGYRLCDEDTDLGLEYALSRLMAKDFVVSSEDNLSGEPALKAPSVERPKKEPAASAHKGASKMERPQNVESENTEEQPGSGDTSNEEGRSVQNRESADDTGSSLESADTADAPVNNVPTAEPSEGDDEEVSE